MYMSFAQLNLIGRNSARYSRSRLHRTYSDTSSGNSAHTRGQGYHGSGPNRHRQDRRFYLADAESLATRRQYQRLTRKTSDSRTDPGAHAGIGGPGVRKRKNLRQISAPQMCRRFTAGSIWIRRQGTARRRGNPSGHARTPAGSYPAKNDEPVQGRDPDTG